MNDTPENIKKIQLQIWLAKSPQERLTRMMKDNAALMQFWNITKKPAPDTNVSQKANNQ
jgi:hypothetical protein